LIASGVWPCQSTISPVMRSGSRRGSVRRGCRGRAPPTRREPN